MEQGKKTTFKNASISEKSRQHILDILKEEGFTEEQLNEMAWEQVWKLYLDSIGELFSRELSPVYNALEKNPQLATTLSPLIKDVRKALEDLEKSAEEMEKKGSQ